MGMPELGTSRWVAIVVSLALHLAVFVLVGNELFAFRSKTIDSPKAQMVFMQVVPELPVPKTIKAPVPIVPQATPVSPASAHALAPDITITAEASVKQPAAMPAPPAPTTEAWAFAARYPLKNSKGYRYNWGQQVRSMMGTAVEGPDQGVVKFRVEISPEGHLVKLETLWTTSPVAEQLARRAIQAMPALPPTPTGKPLIFEKTIAFTPYAADGPPSYQDDCLPDPPAFRNPFAWDGQSPQTRVEPPRTEKPDPQAMEDCLRQLPKDSIEADEARDKRLMDRWGWRK